MAKDKSELNAVVKGLAYGKEGSLRVYFDPIFAGEGEIKIDIYQPRAGSDTELKHAFLFLKKEQVRELFGVLGVGLHT